MATATANEIRAAVLADRWWTLTHGASSFDGTETLSEPWTALEKALRELAGAMVHGVEDSGPAGPSAEYDLFDAFCEELHDEIERRMIGFAERIETARAG